MKDHFYHFLLGGLLWQVLLYIYVILNKFVIVYKFVAGLDYYARHHPAGGSRPTTPNPVYSSEDDDDEGMCLV